LTGAHWAIAGLAMPMLSQTASTVYFFHKKPTIPMLRTPHLTHNSELKASAGIRHDKILDKTHLSYV